MSTRSPDVENLIGKKYKHGFVTEIDSDTLPPGLDEDVIRLISAKKHDPDFSSTVGYAIDTLTRNQEFAHAVAIFELIENEAMRTDPIYLNQISYFRALAGIELDEALENINEALRLYPENEAFRDTRAWVLFQMGRPLEALEDADFAVARMTKPQTGFWSITGELYDYFDQWFPKQDVSVQSEKPLTQREAPIELWTEGALRYHRACILESLLRTDEAQEEWDWLEANRLPTDGTLY